MWFFVSDEHYEHGNSIVYSNRPWLQEGDVELMPDGSLPTSEPVWVSNKVRLERIKEMREALIQNHNEVVTKNDITVHVGDFAWSSNAEEVFRKIVGRLNGNHIFLQGSHDRWLKKMKPVQIWEKFIEKQLVVCCHYSMRKWPRSHYGSWLLYGHSHGGLPPIRNQWDVGVDNNNYYPLSFDQIRDIMIREYPEDSKTILCQRGEA